MTAEADSDTLIARVTDKRLDYDGTIADCFVAVEDGDRANNLWKRAGCSDSLQEAPWCKLKTTPQFDDAEHEWLYEYAIHVAWAFIERFD